jgi:hypothetical protein
MSSRHLAGLVRIRKESTALSFRIDDGGPEVDLRDAFDPFKGLRSEEKTDPKSSQSREETPGPGKDRESDRVAPESSHLAE